MNWTASREECRKRNGDLATIHSGDENELIFKILYKENIYEAWIGLNDIEIEGYYEWSNDHSSFKSWQKGQPHYRLRNEEDCVEFTSGVWNDVLCSEEKVAVCEVLGKLINI